MATSLEHEVVFHGAREDHSSAPAWHILIINSRHRRLQIDWFTAIIYICLQLLRARPPVGLLFSFKWNFLSCPANIISLHIICDCTHALFRLVAVAVAIAWRLFRLFLIMSIYIHFPQVLTGRLFFHLPPLTAALCGQMDTGAAKNLGITIRKSNLAASLHFS